MVSFVYRTETKNRTNSKQNENRKQTMHILTVRVIATSPHVPVVSVQLSYSVTVLGSCMI